MFDVMFDHEVTCALCLARRVERHDFSQECNAVEVCDPCVGTLAALDRRRSGRVTGRALAAAAHACGVSLVATPDVVGRALARIVRTVAAA